METRNIQPDRPQPKQEGSFYKSYRRYFLPVTLALLVGLLLSFVLLVSLAPFGLKVSSTSDLNAVATQLAAVEGIRTEVANALKSDTTVASLNNTIKSQQAMLDDKQATINSQSATVASANAALTNQATQNATIASLNDKIKSQQTIIDNKQATINSQSAAEASAKAVLDNQANKEASAKAALDKQEMEAKAALDKQKMEDNAATNAAISAIVEKTYEHNDVNYSVKAARADPVYSGPGTMFPKANSANPLEAGKDYQVLYTVSGEAIGGNRQWYFLKDVNGFVPESSIK